MLATAHAFDGYRLDPARRTLTSPDGAPVKLTGKTFDALVYLVEHAGQVVDRVTLVQTLWPRRVVEDNNLNQAIAAIRRAIGDEHVATVAGRGYQFVTPVSTSTGHSGEERAAPSSTEKPNRNAAPPAHRAWSRWTIAAAAVALALLAIGAWALRDFSLPQRPRPSIAVLPLENLSPDPAKAYVATGFHEAIVGRLFALDFDVQPPGAVRQYTQGPRPRLTEIARELDVDAVMEGTVRYADDRLRISLTLVAAADGKPLWHDEFDREYADLFSMESEVARNVADALEATLTPQDFAAAEEGYTRDSRAYDLYLTGMDHERRSIYSSDFVIEQYERAVEIDPEFSRAWVRLAFARLTKRRWISPQDPELLGGARTAAERALEITPDLAEARIALAYYQYLDGVDRHEILRNLQTVQSRATRIPEFFQVRANVYEDLGRWEEQLADRSRVVTLEPRKVPFLLGNAEAFAFLRRYDEAQVLADRARELEPNDPGMLKRRAGLALYREGDPREFRKVEARVLSRELPLSPGYVLAAIYARDYDAAVRLLSVGPEAPLLSARAHDYAGRDEQAQGLFATARERLETRLATASPSQRPALEIALGEALVGLGARESGIEHVKAGLRDLGLALPLSASGLRVDAILVFASAGEVELAIAELDGYLASGYGGWSLEGLLPHPAFDPIRDDPRFVEFVAKYRRPDAASECGLGHETRAVDCR